MIELLIDLISINTDRKSKNTQMSTKRLKAIRGIPKPVTIFIYNKKINKQRAQTWIDLTLISDQLRQLFFEKKQQKID